MEVIRVIDGDTVRVDLQIWPSLTQRVDVRISGVDTPEKRTSNSCEKIRGEQATAFTEQFVARGNCTVVNITDGNKFAGRVLGDISCDGELLSEQLIKSGNARPYSGGSKKSWC